MYHESSENKMMKAIIITILILEMYRNGIKMADFYLPFVTEHSRQVEVKYNIHTHSHSHFKNHNRRISRCMLTYLLTCDDGNKVWA
jgi:hypothetical protein